MFYDCLEWCLLQLYRMLYRTCIQVICLCVGMVLAEWVNPLYSNLPFQPKKKKQKTSPRWPIKKHGTFKDSSPFQVTFWISPCRKSHLSRRPPRQCPDLPPRQCPTDSFGDSPVGLLTAKAWRLLGRSSWWQIHLSLGTEKNWHWVRMESIENLVIATSC